MYNEDYTTVAAAVKDLTEGEVVRILNQALHNLNYRANRNKEQAAALALAKQDPRFKDIVQKAKLAVKKSA